MKKYLYILCFLLSTLSGSETHESFWETYTAALRGDKAAQFQVGVIYESGLGIEQNQTQAAQWFEKSALQGHVDAQYNIALMYASGRGVKEDEGIAMMWFARAAKQGDKESRKILLDFIDGKLNKNTKTTMPAGEISDTVEITPTTLVTKAGARVCGKNEQCIAFKVNTVFTSTSKRGSYYKISGTVTKKGWKAYTEEGWIEETSVEVRR